MDKIKVRQATKQGYTDWCENGVADLSFPHSKTRRGRTEENGAICPTMTTTGGLYVLKEITEEQQNIINRLKIRKLTPEECFILMGMTIDDCEKCRAVGVSSSQLYKQAGNGLISNCVQYIKAIAIFIDEYTLFPCLYCLPKLILPSPPINIGLHSVPIG